MTSSETAPVQQSLNSDYYIWTFPGSPVQIHLHLDLAERLLKELGKASNPASKQRVEVGGILIGRAESTAGIEIRDFRPIPCGDRSDSHYVLAAEDWQKVEEAKSAVLSENDGLVTVGYYRSHLREDLRLDKDDLALFRAHFPEPTNIALLIKPLEDGSGTAGFFFWDDGVIDSGFSFNEFPFHPERLRVEAMEQRLRALQQASSRNAVAVEDDPGKIAKKKRTSRLLLIAGVFTLFSALGLGYYVLNRAGNGSSPSENGLARVNTQALALHVKTQGDDLQVNWNRNASILQNGVVSGLLTILDGDFPKREISLGPDELRTTGSIVYAPLSKNVKFRLEIVTASEKATESVLAIKGSSGAAAAGLPLRETTPVTKLEAPAASFARPVPSTFTRNIPATPGGDGNGDQQDAEVSESKAAPGKPFTLPEKTPNTDETWSQITLESPTVTTATNPPASASPVVSLLSPSATLPPPPQPQPKPQPTLELQPAPTPPVQRLELNKSTAIYLGPKAIQKALPRLSNQVRASLTRDTQVEVEVHINTVGKVVRVRVLSATSPQLASAALAAAYLWRFEPAKLRGQDVESDTVLTFEFRTPRG